MPSKKFRIDNISKQSQDDQKSAIHHLYHVNDFDQFYPVHFELVQFQRAILDINRFND